MAYDIHELKMKVRDYECDMEGIVNNANYQHYFEHARHEMCIERGISFAELVEKNIYVVVARVDIRYKRPLRSRDEFVVTTTAERDSFKMLFHQKILLLPERQVCSEATITTVVTVDGKLSRAPELDKYFD
ncbi:MAG: acyl-CoA thioesterase [Salinivirgaceae bacterium]|nr:acyl-CoA thioesterase [Salinivirgaceae bacterium]